jgi:hypothetical protein
MKSFKRKLLKQPRSLDISNHNLFSIRSIIVPVIFILIAASLYYYLSTEELFPQWINKINLALKIFIAFQIIIGAARSLIMPILMMITSIILWYLATYHGIAYFSSADIWQLIIMSGIGFIITIFIQW